MIERTFKFEFDLGDIVYHRTNKKPTRGQIIRWSIDQGGVMYGVIWAGDLDAQSHYDFELTKDFEKEWSIDEE